jgi:hypothetical protein
VDASLQPLHGGLTHLTEQVAIEVCRDLDRGVCELVAYVFNFNAFALVN